MTLQQRIATLNAAHIGRIPGDPPLPKAKPQIPTKRPTVIHREKSINNPPEQVNGSVTAVYKGNQPSGPKQNGVLPPPPLARTLPNGSSKARPPPPPLPARQPSQPPPALPSRRPSELDGRRGSEDSTTSGTSAYSAGTGLVTASRTKSSDSASRVKAPAWGEVELPPLPVRGSASKPRQYSSERPKYECRAPSSSGQVTPPADPATEAAKAAISKPSLPPRLPPRTQSVQPGLAQQAAQSANNQENARKLPPVIAGEALNKVKRSALSFGLNKPDPPPEAKPQHVHDESNQPPPVPLSSRPDIAAIQASKPRPSSGPTSPQPTRANECMTCRDFSGPDNHAAQFPRQTVTSLQTLAIQLTSPFPSHTDKARAIFTWLHWNVRYDVDGFFNKCIKPSTPESTLRSGLAVCEGYAALYTNLAIHAGLEALTTSGHGKGFGHQPLATGSPLPPYDGNHAWNAVRIDGGEWKLLDSCWGAGHIQGAGQPYVQKFAPQYFTMSNEEFGIKHFPANTDHFFLPGGRRMTWEEYIQINPAAWPSGEEPPTVFTSASDYGIAEKSVLPRGRKISPRAGGRVRFQFSLYCEHWTVERTGKGLMPVFMVATHGVDGREKDFVALEHVRGQTPGGGGDVWYCDVEARSLGAAGQTVTLFAVSSFGTRQNARGLTVREFKEGKGRVGMGFQGVAAWDLV